MTKIIVLVSLVLALAIQPCAGEDRLAESLENGTLIAKILSLAASENNFNDLTLNSMVHEVHRLYSAQYGLGKIAIVNNNMRIMAHDSSEKLNAIFKLPDGLAPGNGRAPRPFRDEKGETGYFICEPVENWSPPRQSVGTVYITLYPGKAAKAADAYARPVVQGLIIARLLALAVGEDANVDITGYALVSRLTEKREKETEVREIAIVDAESTIQAHSQSDLVGQPYVLPVDLHVAADENEQVWPYVDEAGRHLVFIAMPVLWRDGQKTRRLGNVYVKVENQ